MGGCTAPRTRKVHIADDALNEYYLDASQLRDVYPS